MHVDNQSSFDNIRVPSNSIKHPNCHFVHTRDAVVENGLYIGRNFKGCVMEMVRSFLADWIHTRPSDASDPDWTPLLPSDSLEFPSDRNHDDLSWGCQCILQESIANIEGVGKEMPSSTHLIMLFILAFPSTGIEDSVSQYYSRARKSSNNTSISRSRATCNGTHKDDDRISKGSETLKFFGSPYSPQDIKESVLASGEIGEEIISMKLLAGNSEESFMWADWIDAAMGYMEGANNVHKPEDMFRGKPSKCDLAYRFL